MNCRRIDGGGIRGGCQNPPTMPLDPRTPPLEVRSRPRGLGAVARWRVPGRVDRGRPVDRRDLDAGRRRRLAHEGPHRRRSADGRAGAGRDLAADPAAGRARRHARRPGRQAAVPALGARLAGRLQRGADGVSLQSIAPGLAARADARDRHRQGHDPAGFAAAGAELAQRSQLHHAVGLHSVANNAGRIVGPGIAGALVVSAGVPAVFGATLASFLLAFLLVASVPRPRFAAPSAVVAGLCGGAARRAVALLARPRVPPGGDAHRHVLPVRHRHPRPAAAAGRGRALVRHRLGLLWRRRDRRCAAVPAHRRQHDSRTPADRRHRGARGHARRAVVHPQSRSC